VAVALVKAYLAAGAVAGLLAGVLLAVVVVVTAVPEAEAVPEIARELGVSVEEARIIYNAVLFGVGGGCWLWHVYFVASCGASVVAS
jgi:hypothetical protein